MILTIDGTAITKFQIEQPTKLEEIRGRKKRAEISTLYDSENYTLPKNYAMSSGNQVNLVGIFSSISAMEAAIHEFFSLSCISTGYKTFYFDYSNGSAASIRGVLKDGVNVTYSRVNQSKITVRLKFKITVISGV